MEDFYDQGPAIVSLFRALFGDFDLDEVMNQSSGYMNALLFLVYLFVAIFIMLSLFLAILAEAQAAVRELRLDGDFTVIHVGGLQSAEDMQRSRATGVELRQWYTGLMHGLAQPEPYSLYARVTALK